MLACAHCGVHLPAPRRARRPGPRLLRRGPPPGGPALSSGWPVIDERQARATRTRADTGRPRSDRRADRRGRPPARRATSWFGASAATTAHSGRRVLLRPGWLAAGAPATAASSTRQARRIVPARRTPRWRASTAPMPRRAPPSAWPGGGAGAGSLLGGAPAGGGLLCAGLRRAGHHAVAAAALQPLARAAARSSAAAPPVAGDDRRRPAGLLALHLLEWASFNYAALLVLPVLMAGVLTSPPAGAGHAAGVTLVLLLAAWPGAWQPAAAAPLMLQAGLAGLGLFVITLLAGELAGRLAREELAARGSLELARQQAQLNRLVIEEMVDGVLVVDRRCACARPTRRRARCWWPRAWPAGAVPLPSAAAWAALQQAVEQAWPTGSWPEAGRDVVLAFATATRARCGCACASCAARAAGDGAPGRAQPSPSACCCSRTCARCRRAAPGEAGRDGPGVGRHRARDPQPAGRHRAGQCAAAGRRAAPAQQRLARMVADNVERLKRIVDDVMEVAPGRRPPSAVIDAAPRWRRGVPTGRARRACRWARQPAARRAAHEPLGVASTPSTCAACWSTCWTTRTAMPAPSRARCSCAWPRRDEQRCSCRWPATARRSRPRSSATCSSPSSRRAAAAPAWACIFAASCASATAPASTTGPAAPRRALRNEFIVVMRARPLPAADRRPAPEPAVIRDPLPTAPPTDASGARLLVVDDEPDLRTLYELTLLREGYDVESAGSVAEAWALLQRGPGGYSASSPTCACPTAPGWTCCAGWRSAGRPRRHRHHRLRLGRERGRGAEGRRLRLPDQAGGPAAVPCRGGLGPGPPPRHPRRRRPCPARGAAAARRPRRRARARPPAARRAPHHGCSAGRLGGHAAGARAHRQGGAQHGAGAGAAASRAPARNWWRAPSTRSARAGAQPFVAVNCGAIPEHLLEAEFFGYRKGAFTGANEDRDGFFQAAQGGTLFLDEIGDLPLAMQSKLLRVIQERAVRPVGAVAELPVNVRIVSATHKDLAPRCRPGRFRQDLFYRLNVIQIACRRCASGSATCRRSARRAERIARDAGVSPPPALTPDALQHLRATFPGNVRELENLLHRAVALSAARHRRDDLGLPDAALDRGAATTAPWPLDPLPPRVAAGGPCPPRPRPVARRRCPATWRPTSTRSSATSWCVRWSATATTARPPARAWACRCGRCATAWPAWASAGAAASGCRAGSAGSR
jgi:two-component system, NtrC family, response regulator PilR